jgi:fructokinase
MASVVSLGELLVDMVSEAPDASLQEAPQFLKAPGGAPANVAVGLARLGASASFVGQVGDDPFGEWLRNTIAAEGVEVSYLFRSQVARTTIAFVATRSDGRKDICFYRNPGADALLSAVDLRPALFDNTQIFHCGSVTLSQSPAREAQLRAAKMAIERDVLVSFDPNWRPSIWPDTQEARALIWEMIGLSDIVKVADEEWEFVTGTTDFEEGAAKIRAQGPRLVVITRGADGAYFNCASGSQTISGEVPGFRVQAVDTLGAGDAFVAGLLWQVLQHRILNGLLNEPALQEIVRFANACGAIATQTAGAIPALPTQAAVQEFLQANPE